MKHHIITLLQSEKGATALEYGLIAALIAAVIAGSVQVVGTQINTLFTTLANTMIAAIGS